MTPENKTAAATLPCPICQRPVAVPSDDRVGPFPFCTERCKLVDLGRWLDGRYQVPAQVTPDETDDGL